MKLAAPTRIIRATISQEARVILPPLNFTTNMERFVTGTPLEKAPYFTPVAEKEAPADVVRIVQILVPANPPARFALDTLPEALGPNRGGYKTPPLAVGVPIRFPLTPGQWIVASVTEGFSVLTLIIEYHSAEAFDG